MKSPVFKVISVEHVLVLRSFLLPNDIPLYGHIPFSVHSMNYWVSILFVSLLPAASVTDSKQDSKRAMPLEPDCVWSARRSKGERRLIFKN